MTTTLALRVQVEKTALSDRDRDCAITVCAFDLATPGPFDRIVRVDGSHAPDAGPTTAECIGLLSRSGLDHAHQTRLVVLDSRWFSLFSGDDSATRESTAAAMGVGANPMSVQWASSAVFACADAAGRAQARSLVSDWLARERVALHPVVKADKDMLRQVQDEARDARERLDDMVRRCYRHIIYLAPKGDDGRSVEFLRLRKDAQSALNGADVWEELRECRKVLSPGEFNGKVLLQLMRDDGYGRPISEMRDSFWSDPHKPLLPSGAAELRDAIYDATASGDIELVGPEGDVHPVRRRDDIYLEEELRSRRAGA